MLDEHLSQSRLKELLHYCPDTGIFTNIKARKKVRVGSTAGHVDSVNGYVRIMIDYKLYLAHRLAWLYIHGEFPPNDIDHVNRVRNDNRICNLRLATRAENMQNISMPRNNTSGYTGVYWHKAGQKWQVEIMLNYKKINLGYFADQSEAISARKAGEQKYHQFQHA